MGCDICDQKASASPPFSPAAVHTCSARSGAKRQVHTRPAKLDFSKLLPPSSPVPIIQGGPGSPGPCASWNGPLSQAGQCRFPHSLVTGSSFLQSRRQAVTMGADAKVQARAPGWERSCKPCHTGPSHPKFCPGRGKPFGPSECRKWPWPSPVPLPSAATGHVMPVPTATWGENTRSHAPHPTGTELWSRLCPATAQTAVWGPHGRAPSLWLSPYTAHWDPQGGSEGTGWWTQGCGLPQGLLAPWGGAGRTWPQAHIETSQQNPARRSWSNGWAPRPDQPSGRGPGSTENIFLLCPHLTLPCSRHLYHLRSSPHGPHVLGLTHTTGPTGKAPRAVSRHRHRPHHVSKGTQGRRSDAARQPQQGSPLGMQTHQERSTCQERREHSRAPC